MKKIPISEIFGPTIQGEGYDQGVPCYFVRTGGCDFACEWCDTPYAVLPHAVRASRRMTQEEIFTELCTLPNGPQWVVLSGGNPLLHDLMHLVTELTMRNMFVSVETQGTKYQPWLKAVDRICLSPKPPSSGMRARFAELDTIIQEESVIGRGHAGGPRIFFKVVVFDSTDYEYAKLVHKMYPHIPFYVSAGNDAGSTVGNPGRVDERTDVQIREDLLNKTRWLSNRVMVDPDMAGVQVQAQFHVLMWGNTRGV
jgi:7-carboxy-7-deazaguanine synthase